MKLPEIIMRTINPYLRKMKHRAYERKANGYSELDDVPLQNLKSWMSGKLKLGSKWIEEFERKYMEMVSEQTCKNFTLDF